MEKFFRTEVLKLDEGFALKLPADVVNDLSLKFGDIVNVTMTRAGFVKIPEPLTNVYKKHLTVLQDLTDNEVSDIVNALDLAKVNYGKAVEMLKEIDENLVKVFNAAREELNKVDKEQMKKDLAAANPF